MTRVIMFGIEPKGDDDAAIQQFIADTDMHVGDGNTQYTVTYISTSDGEIE